MHAHNAIWDTADVRAAVATGDLGAIVRAVRQANHLSLDELARRCGYSASSLSRMERGKQPLRDVRVLRTIADAIGIPPRLLGLADTPTRSVPTASRLARVGRVPAAGDEESDRMRRRVLLAGLAGTAVLGATTPNALAAAAADPVGALETALRTPPAGTIPLSLADLRSRVATAQLVFQHGRYTEIVAVLPGLLSAALATRAEGPTGDDIAMVDGQLAEIYVLASQLMIKLGHDGLAWTTADRAQQAA